MVWLGNEEAGLPMPYEPTDLPWEFPDENGDNVEEEENDIA